MTVDTTINRWEHVGNGVTVDFPYTNRIFASTDLLVYLDAVLQVAGYTVSGVDVDTGGNVTFATAPASGVAVTIVRDVPDTQPLKFINDIAVDTELFGVGLDRGVIQVQQVSAEIARSLRLAAEEAGAPDMTLPALALRASNPLGFDSFGSPIALAAPAGTTTVSAWGATLIVAADEAAGRAVLDVATQGYRVTPQDPATMVLDIAAGSFFNLVTAARVENAAASTAAFVAPAVDPRNDIIHIDRLTGVHGIAAGAELAVPVDPALPAGKLFLYRVRLATTTTEITAAEIDDLRDLELLGAGTAADLNAGALGASTIAATTAYPAGDGGLITGLVPDASKAPPEMANNVTDALKDIDFAAGYCRAENTAARITNTAMTKKLDASWVAGTAQGGLSSSLHPLAAAAATVWCFAVIIGGSADFIFDTDPDCANGIADHSVTAYRNIGAVLTDATPDIVAFSQIGDHFYRDVPVQDYSTGGSTSPVLHPLSVPLGRKMRPLHNHIMESTTTTLIHSLVTDPDQTATAPSATKRTVSTRGTGEYNSVPILVYTDTSGQIRSEQSSTASLNIKGMTFGWIDRRGRDA